MEGTVALHGDKAPAGAPAFALGINETDVVGVDLRHHHGHVLGPAVGAVVGDDRAFQPGIPLLQSLNFLFLHVHGAEHEVHHAGQLFRVRLGVQHRQAFGLLRNGRGHCPAAGNGLLIGLSRAAAAGGQGGKLKPGMALHEGNEALAHHAGGPDDSNAIFFHISSTSRIYLPFRTCIYRRGMRSGQKIRPDGVQRLWL